MPLPDLLAEANKNFDAGWVIWSATIATVRDTQAAASTRRCKSNVAESCSRVKLWLLPFPLVAR